MRNVWAAVGAWLYRVARHKMVWLMVGGAVGTCCRYELGRWIGSQPWAQGFPFGTFVINVSGSFVLGLAGAVLLERLPEQNNNWFLLIGTGFCGGYTTFSTFSWETAQLIRDGSWPVALVNVVGSVVAGLAGVFLALALVHAIFPRQ